MKIAVFCSAVDNLPSHWQQGAEAVGRWIGSHGDQMIYGGVDAGLMSIASRACKAAGGTVVGIVPSRRAAQASPINDVRVPTSDLNDRKGVMQLLSDVYVVLPGGAGTFDEFATCFSYISFTANHHKRIIIYNPDGLYDHLLAQLQVFIDRGLMKASNLDFIDIANNTDDVIAALDRFRSSYNKQSR